MTLRRRYGLEAMDDCNETTDKAYKDSITIRVTLSLCTIQIGPRYVPWGTPYPIEDSMTSNARSDIINF